MSNPEAFDTAFGFVREAVESGRIPGAVFGIVARDGTQRIVHVGHAQIVPERIAMTPDTIFDLASLTKVIFTTTTILRLVAQGRIGLDDKLIAAIPDLRQYDANARERAVTFRQCLTHQTHMSAVEPLYTYGQDPQTLRAFVLQRIWPPRDPVYSDINFIMLGISIERLTGRPLGEQPLAPGFTFKPDPARCAATELCAWRGRVMRGEVHDENAFALGGASGHAGLFGNANAVLGFARTLLDGSVLPAAQSDALFAPNTATRTLGWEIRNPDWAGGQACPPTTIGHTGFTGTGLWINREAGFAWTLLTNRVHPSRHIETGIMALRRAVGDALHSS